MAYLPALKNGFVWDDNYFITELPFLRDPALWWRHIQEPLFVSQNYFRPLPLLTFVLEAQVEPLNAFVFHLSNLLLHALNTTLVVLLARTLTAKGDASSLLRPLVAGLLFGLHPVLIESVSWISDRFDLMMASFLLLGLLCDSGLKHRKSRTMLVGLSFFLALLCKETAIVFIALLPLWQLMRNADEGTSWLGRIRKTASDAWPIWGSLLVAIAIYLYLRHQAIGGFYRSDTPLVPGTTLQHLLLTTKTIGWYLLLLCWPFGQIGPVHPGTTPVSLSDPLAWSGLVATLAMAGATLAALRRAPRAGLMICAALVALTPVAHLVPLTIGDNIVHDRYLLLPLVFASLLLATAPVGRFRRAAIVGTGLWTAMSLATITAVVPFWESNLSLWGWASAQEPKSNIARGNYVSALVDNGHPQAALDLSKEILTASPDNPIAIYDMALALMRLGRNDEAREYCELALKHFGNGDKKGRMDVAEVWNLLGYLSLHSGDWGGAEKALLESARLMPYLTRPHFNLAMLYYQTNRIDDGDRELAFALRYDSPTAAFSHRLLACKKRAEALAKRSSLPGDAQAPGENSHPTNGGSHQDQVNSSSVCEERSAG